MSMNGNLKKKHAPNVSNVNSAFKVLFFYYYFYFCAVDSQNGWDGFPGYPVQREYYGMCKKHML